MAEANSNLIGPYTKDIAGKEFGRLTAIEPNGRTKDGKALWFCKCKCGNTKTVSGYLLRSGRTRSCGCISSENTTKRNLTHGLRGTREYNIWASMIARCHNPNAINYPDYGGRGIHVCDRWRHSFEQFISDMSRCPPDKESIDRYPDNDGNYQPGNCRWATRIEQNRRKRNLCVYEFRGERHCISEWAEIIGISAKALQLRLHRRRWSIEKALTTPLLSSRWGTVKQPAKPG